VISSTRETERIQRIYDERAATYDRSLGIIEHRVLGPMRQAFGALLRGYTLEVAIGTGLNLPFYAPLVTNVVGSELSSPMLVQAKARARQVGLRFAGVQADATELPFRDASFDTVAISLALCTVPEPAAALLEMARVCRPDGRVILLEHVRSTAAPLALVQRVLTPMQVRSQGCHLDRDTIALAESLGFRCQVVQSRVWNAVRLVVAQPPQLSRATLAAIR
jgi:ubiquinone/menaquinone biosynthesis C-methylase UbiE